jgi:hypothetical protein
VCRVVLRVVSRWFSVCDSRVRGKECTGW